jgi:hypothetical protein
MGLKRLNVYPHGSEKKRIIDLTLIDSEEKAYVVGFLAADGNLHRPNNRSWMVSVHLARKDYGHLRKLVDIISPESTVRPTKAGMVQFSLGDEELGEQLYSHGIVPRKTGVLAPPSDLPVDLEPHYIRGYFDGDGYVGISNGLPHCITAGNPSFLEFIKQRFNIFYENKCNVTKQRTVHVLHQTGTTARRFCQYIYGGASVYMERKYNIAKRITDGR